MKPMMKHTFFYKKIWDEIYQYLKQIPRKAKLKRTTKNRYFCGIKS